ncbi:hypothetical protein HYH03_014019 [Edaphochlamys debaryana]|uniref:Cilium assembly protein DZIP1 N-terminal domain-containing protein n=1 Tax=Edaphochlamys debaryana TaxID=47281 RepID=A0A836BST7_9CHLO|nr:hypothetical protein HYH03_014019 [Edaphochlamys debaryana]|eukprot:KAG2487452.1 hypothetical protein HYH03_014019 [Edaphochlamys debaryana]
MSSASLVRLLAKQSDELSKDIDSFSDRAFELQRLAKALQERSGRETVEKATQVETTAVGAPSYQLDRAKRLAPFAFSALDRKVNWRKIRAINVDRVERDTDVRSVLELYGELAYANLDKESVYDLSEANLLKLVRCLQMLVQYQQFQIEQGLATIQILKEDQVATVGLLRMLPHVDVSEVEEHLIRLQKDFYRVADADMDAMFAQVRTEERTGARDTVGVNVDQTKATLDLTQFGIDPNGGPDGKAGAERPSAARRGGSVTLAPGGQQQGSGAPGAGPPGPQAPVSLKGLPPGIGQW